VKPPAFRDLPVAPGAPAESSWGVFGDDDELGTLNLLGPEGVVAAAGLVETGEVFRLDTPIGYADPPLFGRSPHDHRILDWRHRGFLAFDDELDRYNTSEGAQWDGLGHVGHPEHGFYNGVAADDIVGRRRLGIHLWAHRVVGRGALVDLFAYRGAVGRPIDPFDQVAYTVEDVEAAVAAQVGTVAPGSILMVRTGWMGAYRAASQASRTAMADADQLRSCGLEATSRMVEWLWDHRVAALATDCPAVEPFPWDGADPDALHHRTLALLGMPIGEQFDLEALAAHSAADGRYESMFVSAPLVLRGGVNSPPNAVAIK
jgi:kynurenine formamidase